MAKDLNFLDNKIVVLYVLQNAYPKSLSIDQIVKYLEEFDDITYFDICTYIESLKKSLYILEKGTYHLNLVIIFKLEPVNLYID